MCKLYILLIFAITFSSGKLYSQATLPDFTFRTSNKSVMLLWRSQYPQQIKGITVQRSYDSTKNFSSVASVINPQNAINGFNDINPPYHKMYYRLFIGFDSGIYIITESRKPGANNGIDYGSLITEINALYEKNNALQPGKSDPKKKPAAEPATKNPAKEIIQKEKPVNNKTVKPAAEALDTAIVNDFITYPSKRIYTDKENNIVITLPNIKEDNYLIKFFTEDYKPLFELKNLQEDYISVEKVNFEHAGWFTFEIFKNGLLLEENKFYIPKD
mgnify:CR=1 FL=1